MPFLTHLIAATLLGSLIGLERQWRQRFAGLRTNALVCAGAAAFVGAALSLAGNNPAPMVGQIISGIGFLGAGVIYKEDFNVRGLNTAATIWCSAAVGMLCGLDLLLEAAATAGMVIGVNLVLRPLVRRLGERPASRDSETQTVYAIRMVCAPKSEARLRSALVQAAYAAHLSLKTIHSEKGPKLGLNILAELSVYGRNDHSIEEVSGALSQDPAVRSLRWELIHSDNSFE
jgi:putative Mg2+ transporter-C (MgtC) family protein